MIEKKSWEEFRTIGLLWFINRILHTFGWAICYKFDEKDKSKLIEVFPARVKFRGFSEKKETEGFINLTKYISENINELKKETLE
jgi:hypothetical protein